MNFEEGGRRFYAMVSPEGEEHWSVQDFTSISPITGFQFTDAFTDSKENRKEELPTSEWTLDFNESGGITTVCITIKHKTLADLEHIINMGFKEGFTMTMNCLEELLNTTSNKSERMDSIKIKTKVAANVQKVWQYWTKPEHIQKWNFATPDWHCPTVKNDLRVGGNYTARMEAKDGSYGFDFEAVYDEIIIHKKITYTMTDGRKATTFFEQSGNETSISTTFDAEKEHSVEMQKDGWQAILNNFKKYAETA